jgi:hypothetical protein
MEKVKTGQEESKVILNFALGIGKICGENITRLLLPLLVLSLGFVIWLRVADSPSQLQLVLLALFGVFGIALTVGMGKGK